LEAVHRVLGHRTVDHGFEARSETSVGRIKLRKAAVDVTKHLRRAIALWEGHLSSQGLEEDAPKRVDVSPCIHPLTLKLLWRDVIEGADELPGRRELGGGAGGASDTEVRNQRIGVAFLGRQQNVGRLYVTMDQAGGMDGIQPRGCLADDRDRVVGS
jgi:hypothetical protein